VSSPATIRSETSTSPVAPVSRLIMGASFTGNGVRRKLPQAPADDRREGNAQAAENLGKRIPRLTLNSLLPTTLIAGQRHGLAAKMLTDLFVLLLSFAAVIRLLGLMEYAIGGDSAILPPSLPFSGPDLGLPVLYGTLVILLAHAEGLYQRDLMREPTAERLIVARVMAWTTLLVGTAIWMAHLQISILALAIAAPLNYLGMLGWRDVRTRLATRRGGSGKGIRNVLIVGAGKLGRAVAVSLEHDHAGGRVVLGFLDEYQPVGGDIRGRIGDLARIARAEFVDEIILAIPPERELGRRVIEDARRNRLDVKLVPDLLGFQAQSGSFETFGTVPILTLHEEQSPVLGLFLKRAADITSSLAGLFFTVPMLAVIALVIKWDSPGPVLYRALRVGKKGRNFLCYKFRTMVTDADKLKEHLLVRNEREGAFFKIKNDPRITYVGHFLRRYSLDEVPQLWNVLRGDMSLVGPRPHPCGDVEHYGLADLRRLDVTPGMTGLWQVTARRDPSFERNMELDLEYIEKWNLWMDLRILYKTLSAVMEGSGM
jgi:exopolysaccharide biosynthesis polyprenyl glycosylphosphotransferase